MQHSTSFGEQLRRYRELAGLTQEQLAEKAGLTPKAVGALERGERRQPYPRHRARVGPGTQPLRGGLCCLAGCA